MRSMPIHLLYLLLLHALIHYTPTIALRLANQSRLRIHVSTISCTTPRYGSIRLHMRDTTIKRTFLFNSLFLFRRDAVGFGAGKHGQIIHYYGPHF